MFSSSIAETLPLPFRRRPGHPSAADTALRAGRDGSTGYDRRKSARVADTGCRRRSTRETSKSCGRRSARSVGTGCGQRFAPCSRWRRCSSKLGKGRTVIDRGGGEGGRAPNRHKRDFNMSNCHKNKTIFAGMPVSCKTNSNREYA